MLWRAREARGGVAHTLTQTRNETKTFHSCIKQDVASTQLLPRPLLHSHLAPARRHLCMTKTILNEKRLNIFNVKKMKGK